MLKCKKANKYTNKQLCTTHIKNECKMQMCNKQKKCRTNLVIAIPKKQEITQRKGATLIIKFNTKFAAKRSDRNSILRACGAHSREPV